MSTHRYNPNLVKIYRNYTVEEIAQLFKTHKNTIREWIKKGLHVVDDRRPTLILGSKLKAYLQASRQKNKQPCHIGELYCVKCRKPQKPAAQMADYKPITEKVGHLIALCPDCCSIMNQRVSAAKLEIFSGQMNITFTQALKRIDESD